MESWTIDLLGKKKKKKFLKCFITHTHTHTQTCLHKDTKNNLPFGCYLAFSFLDFLFIYWTVYFIWS